MPEGKQILARSAFSLIGKRKLVGASAVRIRHQKKKEKVRFLQREDDLTSPRTITIIMRGPLSARTGDLRKKTPFVRNPVAEA